MAHVVGAQRVDRDPDHVPGTAGGREAVEIELEQLVRGLALRIGPGLELRSDPSEERRGIRRSGDRRTLAPEEARGRKRERLELGEAVGARREGRFGAREVVLGSGNPRGVDAGGGDRGGEHEDGRETSPRAGGIEPRAVQHRPRSCGHRCERRHRELLVDLGILLPVVAVGEEVSPKRTNAAPATRRCGPVTRARRGGRWRTRAAPK